MQHREAPAADIDITRKHCCGLRLTVAPVAISSFALLRQNNDSKAKPTVHIAPNLVHHRLRISY